MSAPLPTRIQLSRAPGFRLEAASLALNGLPAVKCDRGTRYGNPWRTGLPIDLRQARRWGWAISRRGRRLVPRTSTEAVLRFGRALLFDVAIHDRLREALGGRNLACWCDRLEPCHCDALLFVANATPAAIAAIVEAADAEILAACALLDLAPPRPMPKLVVAA
jgi:hypothetical protein